MNPDPPATTSSRKHERLQLAMNLADRMRQQEQDESWYGVREGLMAAGLCLAVVLPLRYGILRWSGGRFGHLPDLLVTPCCAMATWQAGLWTGSLHGAARHLEQVAHMPHTDLVKFCDGVPTITFDQGLSSVENPKSSTWNPEETALVALGKALQRCEHNRNEDQSQEHFRIASS